jgi:hypothetical protein
MGFLEILDHHPAAREKVSELLERSKIRANPMRAVAKPLHPVQETVEVGTRDRHAAIPPHWVARLKMALEHPRR